jgi:hypothetical protein
MILTNVLVTNVLVKDVIRAFDPSLSLLYFNLNRNKLLYAVYAISIEYIIPSSLCLNPRQDLSLDLKGKRIDIKLRSLFNCICSHEINMDKIFLSNCIISNKSVYTSDSFCKGDVKWDLKRLKVVNI